MIDILKNRPAKLDHVNVDAARGEVIEQRFHNRFGRRVQKKCAVNKVDANDAQGFLLLDVARIEHTNVHHNFAGFAVRLGLKTHAHPAMTFVAAFKIARRDRIGEHEKLGVGTTLFV